MFTFIIGNHETNNSNFNLNLDDIKNDYKHGLKGCHFIGMIELAYFKNIVHDGGELIAPHLQGIMWTNLTRANKENINNIFVGGRNGAIPYYSRKVKNIIGAVSYMHKLPVHGYMLRDKRSYAHTSEYLSLPRQYFLHDKLREIKFANMLVAGGEGVVLRNSILNHLKATL